MHADHTPTTASTRWERLGERVRRARVARGLDVSALAERTGVDVADLEAVEAGRRALSEADMMALAAVLRVPVAYIADDPAPVIARMRAALTVTAYGDPDVLDLDLALQAHLADAEELRELRLIAPMPVVASGPVVTADDVAALATSVLAAPGGSLDVLDVAAAVGLWLAVDDVHGGAMVTIEPGFAIGILGGRDRHRDAARLLACHLLGADYAWLHDTDDDTVTAALTTALHDATTDDDTRRVTARWRDAAADAAHALWITTDRATDLLHGDPADEPRQRGDAP